MIVSSPESEAARAWPLPEVDESRCTLCGLCVRACPCGAIELGERGPIFRCGDTCLHSATCVCVTHCLFPCEAVCATGAISCTFEIVAEARGGTGQ